MAGIVLCLLSSEVPSLRYSLVRRLDVLQGFGPCAWIGIPAWNREFQSEHRKGGDLFAGPSHRLEDDIKVDLKDTVLSVLVRVFWFWKGSNEHCNGTLSFM